MPTTEADPPVNRHSLGKPFDPGEIPAYIDEGSLDEIENAELPAFLGLVAHDNEPDATPSEQVEPPKPPDFRNYWIEYAESHPNESKRATNNLGKFKSLTNKLLKSAQNNSDKVTPQEASDWYASSGSHNTLHGPLLLVAAEAITGQLESNTPKQLYESANMLLEYSSHEQSQRGIEARDEASRIFSHLAKREDLPFDIRFNSAKHLDDLEYQNIYQNLQAISDRFGQDSTEFADANDNARQSWQQAQIRSLQLFNWGIDNKGDNSDLGKLFELYTSTRLRHVAYADNALLASSIRSSYSREDSERSGNAAKTDVATESYSDNFDLVVISPGSDEPAKLQLKYGAKPNKKYRKPIITFHRSLEQLPVKEMIGRTQALLKFYIGEQGLSEQAVLSSTDLKRLQSLEQEAADETRNKIFTPE